MRYGFSVAASVCLDEWDYARFAERTERQATAASLLPNSFPIHQALPRGGCASHYRGGLHPHSVVDLSAPRVQISLILVRTDDAMTIWQQLCDRTLHEK
jgi:hypothetical protein